MMQDRKLRSRSSKRSFVKEGKHQDWTNTFSRSTVKWDEKYGILEDEKAIYPKGTKLKKYPSNCCGNSPGKQRIQNIRQYEAYDDQVRKLRKASVVAINNAYGGKRAVKAARIIKSAPRLNKKSQASAIRRVRRPKQMGDTI